MCFMNSHNNTTNIMYIHIYIYIYIYVERERDMDRSASFPQEVFETPGMRYPVELQARASVSTSERQRTLPGKSRKGSTLRGG